MRIEGRAGRRRVGRRARQLEGRTADGRGGLSVRRDDGEPPHAALEGRTFTLQYRGYHVYTSAFYELIHAIGIERGL